MNGLQTDPESTKELTLPLKTKKEFCCGICGSKINILLITFKKNGSGILLQGHPTQKLKNQMNYIKSPWKDNIGNGLYLRIPRKLILEKNWGKLHPSAKAIYLPLIKHVNTDGEAWPCCETLGQLAGISRKTAGNGIKYLEGFPGFQKQPYFTRRGHKSYKYVIKAPSKDPTISMYISHDFINGGNWSQLKPVGKAIFPVLLNFAWWEKELYLELKETYVDERDDEEIYKTREYDIFDGDKKLICELAGISFRSLDKAILSLNENYFIKPQQYNGKEIWKIMIFPSIYFKPSFLIRNQEKLFSEKITL